VKISRTRRKREEKMMKENVMGKSTKNKCGSGD
jgi:hypothetical protein